MTTTIPQPIYGQGAHTFPPACGGIACLHRKRGGRPCVSPLLPSVPSRDGVIKRGFQDLHSIIRGSIDTMHRALFVLLSVGVASAYVTAPGMIGGRPQVRIAVLKQQPFVFFPE
jgi:hypothetical protein